MNNTIPFGMQNPNMIIPYGQFEVPYQMNQGMQSTYPSANNIEERLNNIERRLSNLEKKLNVSSTDYSSNMHMI